MTSGKARNEFVGGVSFIINHPYEALKAFVGEKYELYSSVLSGHGSPEQQYEVGKELGNLVFGVATGAAATKLTEVIKDAKYEKKLIEAAEAADKVTGPGKATTRGTAIHKKFEKSLPKGKSEVSYKDKKVVKYGTKGSARADAIYGKANKPKIAYDLKTGKTGIKSSEAKNMKNIYLKKLN